MSDLVQEEVRERLHYDPQTGAFTWLKMPGELRAIRARNTKHAGKAAGTLAPAGYLRVNIARHPYLAHRLAWLYMTGEWPIGEIDHIDGNRANNAWANLRDSTRSQNAANSGPRCDNRLGVKGVGTTRMGNRFRAGIRYNGKSMHLGTFDTAEEASAAYAEAAQRIFGEFARSE